MDLWMPRLSVIWTISTLDLSPARGQRGPVGCERLQKARAGAVRGPRCSGGGPGPGCWRGRTGHWKTPFVRLTQL